MRAIFLRCLMTAGWVMPTSRPVVTDATPFHQQEKDLLLHVGKLGKDAIDDVVGDQFPLDFDGRSRRGGSSPVAVGNLIVKHSVPRALQGIDTPAELEVVATVKLTALQVPTQRLARLRRLDSDKMHEHLLHQVLLKFRIGSQFPCYPMQLTDDLILSHSNHPYTLGFAFSV